MKSELNLKIRVGKSKIVELAIANNNGYLTIKVNTNNRPLNINEKNELKDIVRYIFRLDEDLSGFYRICSNDPQLKFVDKIKSGRLLRSPTVFEDIIKTICTTNCSWSNTKMMVSNLCDLEDGCFPSPETILRTGINKL